MESILAGRMQELGTETAFEVLAKAKALEKQGREIIHLEIGEPDFDTPKNIRDAATQAMNGTMLGWSIHLIMVWASGKKRSAFSPQTLAS